MKKSGNKHIFTTCLRESGPQFTKGQRPAKGNKSANHPKPQHNQRISQKIHQKTGGRKYSGANYVGYHNIGHREKPQLSLQMFVKKIQNIYFSAIL